jgi:hypothetical protein
LSRRAAAAPWAEHSARTRDLPARSPRRATPAACLSSGPASGGSSSTPPGGAASHLRAPHGHRVAPRERRSHGAVPRRGAAPNPHRLPAPRPGGERPVASVRPPRAASSSALRPHAAEPPAPPQAAPGATPREESPEGPEAADAPDHRHASLSPGCRDLRRHSPGCPRPPLQQRSSLGPRRGSTAGVLAFPSAREMVTLAARSAVARTADRPPPAAPWFASLPALRRRDIAL